MAEKFSNFARTTLAASLTDVATTLTVEYATNFPTSGDFRVRCQNELMLVTNVSGTTFTVTRGVEGTTAAAHDAGVGIAHVMTAASLDAAIDQHVHASDLAFAADSTYDIGSATVRPANVYADLVDTPEVVSQGELVLNTQTGVTIESGLEIGHESKWSIDNDIIPMNLDGQQYIGYDDGAIDERVNIYGRTVNIDDDLTVESEDIPIVTLRKADPGPALVDDDDVLGVVSFQGYDGAAYVESAVIRARIDGTTGASGDLPTELLFSTKPDGAGAIAERWRISPAGQLEPMVDYSVNIGGPTFRIANLYAGGTLYSGGLEMTHVSSTNINFIRDDTAITDGEHLGALYFRGKDTGGTTRAGSSIIGEAAGANGASYVTGKLLFGTTPSGGPLTDRWEISNTGHLIPAADSTYDIGSATDRPANIYADNVDTASLTGIGALTLTDAGNARIELDGATGSYIDFHGPTSTDYGARLIVSSDTGGTGTGAMTFYGASLTPQGGAQLGLAAHRWGPAYLGATDLSGHLTVAADSTYDIGSASVRPANIYTDALYASGSVYVRSAAPYLYLDDTSSLADQGAGEVIFQGNGFNLAGIKAIARMNTPATNDSPGDLVFSTTADGAASPTDRWRITYQGHLEPDSTNAFDVGIVNRVRFVRARGFDAQATSDFATLSLTVKADVDAYEPLLSFERQTAAGSGPLSVAEGLGTIRWFAHDGSIAREIAKIRAAADGTPAAGDLPTKIIFSVAADGASSTTDRWVLDNTGAWRPNLDSAVDIGTQYTRPANVYADVLDAPQIKFPATQSASSDANTLDDYEEGTWTPAITFDTPGNLSVAYDTRAGTYIKVGKQVTVWFKLFTSTFTHTTASGYLRITGLPFTASVDVHWAGGGIEIDYATVTRAQLTPRATANTTYIQVWYSVNGATSDLLTASHLVTGVNKSIYAMVTYCV